MTKTYWTEGAVGDLDRIRTYLSAIDLRAARRLADRIEAVVATLIVTTGEAREQLITFPYLLRYRGDADAVIIDAVRHASDARIV